jgi:hypothetical protein
MNTRAKRGTGGRKPPDDPEQSKRFEEAARELGTDEDGKVFKKAIERALPVKPPIRKP